MTARRAGQMQMLARVETARESRCRSVLMQSEAVSTAMDRAAQAAKVAVERTRVECREALDQRYVAAYGLHAARDIQALRAMEIRMAARQVDAAAAEQEAETAARVAQDAMKQAQQVWRLVSQRCQRRFRLAETLRHELSLAATAAEEQVVADELMDRVSAELHV